MRKTVRDKQIVIDEHNKLEQTPEVPQVMVKVMVKTLPGKPGFAPKWNGPYEVIISGDTCACKVCKVGVSGSIGLS